MQVLVSDTLAEPVRNAPERNLLVAMLERAIFDFYGNDIKEQEAAAEWLFGEVVEENDAFSFPWICQQLDLIREEILDGIKSLTPRNFRTTQQWWSELQAA